MITPELLGWAARREVARLKTFLARFELLTSDDGKNSVYQKVLAAINDAKHHGLSSRELQRNCWAFRSLGLEARADLMKALVDDGEIIDLIPNGKRATSYFGRLFVNTTEASS